VLEFLPELRPAWWVLRGYLAVQWASVGLSYLLAGSGLGFPIPELFGTQVLGLLAVATAVPVSVALGRRGTTHRGLALLGNAAFALFGLFLLVDLGASRYAAEAYWDQSQYEMSGSSRSVGLRADGREINNLFPFDATGRPLRDVYLVDQDGNPVVATQVDQPRRCARRRDRCVRPDPGYPAGGWVGVTTEKWPPAGSARTAMRP
jgi:hypothetical protein